jgi:hypothetical protein
VLHCSVPCRAVRYCAVLCCAVLCCAVLCCTVLYCAVLCCTVLPLCCCVVVSCAVALCRRKVIGHRTEGAETCSKSGTRVSETSEYLHLLAVEECCPNRRKHQVTPVADSYQVGRRRLLHSSYCRGTAWAVGPSCLVQAKRATVRALRLLGLLFSTARTPSLFCDTHFDPCPRQGFDWMG